MTPPTASFCPPMNVVAISTTTSTPKSRGRQTAGDARYSQITTMPRACANSGDRLDIEHLHFFRKRILDTAIKTAEQPAAAPAAPAASHTPVEPKRPAASPLPAGTYIPLYGLARQPKPTNCRPPIGKRWKKSAFERATTRVSGFRRSGLWPRR